LVTGREHNSALIQKLTMIWDTILFYTVENEAVRDRIAVNIQ